jgi:probable selenium-dependent hydroxylase accessory protein YqeC
LFLIEDVNAFLSATAQIQAPVIVGAGHNVDDEGQLVGLPTAWLDHLAQSGQFDSILVEADSAKSRLFKVPSAIEPLVPKGCDLTVWIMAIKTVGKPISPAWVDEAERLSYRCTSQRSHLKIALVFDSHSQIHPVCIRCIRPLRAPIHLQ